MIEGPEDGSFRRRLSRPLMVGGLGLWGVGVSGALAPPVMRTILYPNHTETLQFERVAADPFGAPILWTVLVIWCLSWAFIVGHIAATWAARQGHPSWATPVLLLLSLASPIVFDVVVPVLHRLATRDPYPGNGVVPFLPAIVVQLVISQAYAHLTGLRPRVTLQRADGA